MIDIRIDTSKLLSRLKEHIEIPCSRAAEAMKAGAAVIQKEAKFRAPVDTGTLRRSIRTAVSHENGDIVARVGTNVHYAIHVEYGHRTVSSAKGARPIRWIPGRYFLKGAFDSQKGNAVKLAALRLKKGV